MTDIRETTPATHALRLLREEHGRMLDLLVECARAGPSAKRERADNLIAEVQLHILMAHEAVFAAADRVARSREAIERVDRHSAETGRLAEEVAEVKGDAPRLQERLTFAYNRARDSTRNDCCD
jgi:hypothetical protein